MLPASGPGPGLAGAGLLGVEFTVFRDFFCVAMYWLCRVKKLRAISLRMNIGGSVKNKWGYRPVAKTI